MYNEKVIDVTRDTIIACYQIFLNRNPENESVIKKKMRIRSFQDLRRNFLLSKEFRQNMLRLQSGYDETTSIDKADENTIRCCYNFILNRDPKNGELEQLSKKNYGLSQLRKEILLGKEFLNQYQSLYASEPIVLFAENDSFGKEIFLNSKEPMIAGRIDGINPIKNAPLIDIEEVVEKKCKKNLIAVSVFHKQRLIIERLTKNGLPFSIHPRVSSFMHVYGRFPYVVFEPAERNPSVTRRSEIIKQMYLKMFSLYHEDFSGKHVDIWINMEDNPFWGIDLINSSNISHVMAFCTVFPIQDQVIPIPDYSSCFDEDNYAYELQHPRDCKKASEEMWNDKRAFWRGSIFTSITRRFLMELGKKNPSYLRIEDSSIGEFMPMTKQARYKYLIDTRGNAWSIRLQTLLQLGRPILLVERPYREWYFHKLEPMKHYIPVKEDLSDLVDKIIYMEDHPEIYQKIVENMKIFVKNNLTPQPILSALKAITLRYGIGRNCS